MKCICLLPVVRSSFVSYSNNDQLQRVYQHFQTRRQNYSKAVTTVTVIIKQIVQYFQHERVTTKKSTSYLVLIIHKMQPQNLTVKDYFLIFQSYISKIQIQDIMALK